MVQTWCRHSRQTVDTLTAKKRCTLCVVSSTRVSRVSISMYVRHSVLFLQEAGDDRFADYQPKRAFLFPGQGAQTVGMAKVIKSHHMIWL